MKMVSQDHLAQTFFSPKNSIVALTSEEKRGSEIVMKNLVHHIIRAIRARDFSTRLKWSGKLDTSNKSSYSSLRLQHKIEMIMKNLIHQIIRAVRAQVINDWTKPRNNPSQRPNCKSGALPTELYPPSQVEHARRSQMLLLFFDHEKLDTSDNTSYSSLRLQHEIRLFGDTSLTAF